ncbi:methyltransferase, FkbM family [Selenomonas sp. GACV-9]|uniref:FkbM family methyltransferase n=1 Tax=Selenomonas sp. GACV-9 TaxID=3158782 RepID=UPI0008E57F25|nr:methyltransferase, FkbM family [Selenomonas ruminantium]
MINVSLCHIFPFSRVPKGVPVIIWGKGNVGSQYYNELIASKYTKDIQWVDSNDVKDLRCFTLKSKDKYIVVAMASENDRNEVVNKLLHAGIDDSKVISDQPQFMLINPSNKTGYVSFKLSIFSEEIRYAINRFHELLKLKNAKGYKYLRVGNSNDGGYVMLDDLTGGIAYSFGISNDVSWDASMVLHGYEVYMYDHTISNLPREIDGFKFFREGIAGKEENDELKFLTTFLERNHHDKTENMILKIDVEGAEWDVLNQIDEDVLKQFSQILFEFHGLMNFDELSKYVKVIEKINRTHQAVHYHINNYSKVIWINDHPFANTIEVTFVNREKYIFEDNMIMLPRDEDAPNWRDYPEIEIGNWNDTEYYGT